MKNVNAVARSPVTLKSQTSLSASKKPTLLNESDLSSAAAASYKIFKAAMQEISKKIVCTIEDDADGSVENDMWIFNAEIPRGTSITFEDLDDLNDKLEFDITLYFSASGELQLQAIS